MCDKIFKIAEQKNPKFFLTSETIDAYGQIFMYPIDFQLS